MPNDIHFDEIITKEFVYALIAAGLGGTFLLVGAGFLLGKLL